MKSVYGPLILDCHISYSKLKVELVQSQNWAVDRHAVPCMSYVPPPSLLHTTRE